MISPQVRRFQNLGADLISSDHATRPAAFGRQFLGIGRVVELNARATGVYGRYGGPLVIDFIQDRNSVSRASYHVKESGIVTVGTYEHPERGLSVPDLAREVGGIALQREPLNDIEDIVSDMEMEFVEEFLRDPRNNTAMFSFAGADRATHLDVSYLSSNLPPAN